MTVMVVARQTFPYARITRRFGDVFEAAPNDARLLAFIGRVDISSEKAPVGPASSPQQDNAPRQPRSKRHRDQADDIPA